MENKYTQLGRIYLNIINTLFKFNFTLHCKGTGLKRGKMSSKTRKFGLKIQP